MARDALQILNGLISEEKNEAGAARAHGEDSLALEFQHRIEALDHARQLIRAELRDVPAAPVIPATALDMADRAVAVAAAKYEASGRLEDSFALQALCNLRDEYRACELTPAFTAVAQTADVVPPYSLDVKRLARASEGYRGYGWEITARGFALDAVIADALAVDARLRAELDARDVAARDVALAALDTAEGL